MCCPVNSMTASSVTALLERKAMVILSCAVGFGHSTQYQLPVDESGHRGSIYPLVQGGKLVTTRNDQSGSQSRCKISGTAGEAEEKTRRPQQALHWMSLLCVIVTCITRFTLWSPGRASSFDLPSMALGR